MKKIKIMARAGTLVILGLTGLMAGEAPMKPYVGSVELEQIKKLEGHWEGTTTEMAPDPDHPMTVTVDYHVSSGGSIVQETLFAGTPHEMLTVYSDENGKLAATHYCMLHNQPHMTLRPAGAGEIALEVQGRSGRVDLKSPHMHALTLDLSIPGKLVQKWTSYEGGKPKNTSIFEFSKKS